MSGFLIASVESVSLLAVLADVWSATWPYLLMLAGFSAIIFVHELGHFAVAKWADVRVERFAIGFGRELFGFTRGETRYSWNILPLGGYVKMLGQEDFDDKSNELRFNDDPRSFVNKPVGHRMAIVSAGVIMNVLFACLLFMIVFLVGMESDAPRIAYVEPDSPADRAGIEPGDWVKKINGKTVLEYQEVMMSILLAPPHEPIEFVIERNGETAAPIYVKPDYRIPDNTRDPQRQVIGIGSSRSREIVYVGPEIRGEDPGAPKPGDVIVEFDGIAVTDENINNMVEMLGYRSMPVIVERKSPDRPEEAVRRVEVTIPPRLSILPSDPTDPETAGILGLTPLARFESIDPRGRAHLAGLSVGDTVLEWDDRPFPSSAEIAASIRDNPESDIAFVVQRPDGRKVEGSVRPKRHKRGPATVQAMVKAVPDVPSDGSVPHARFVEVRRGGVADRAGIKPGDLVVQCDNVPNPSLMAVNRIIREGARRTLSLVVQGADGGTRQVLLRPIPPGSIDAIHSLIADDVMRVGRIVPTIHGKPSPAARAGIPRGATIVSINEHNVLRWRHLIELFREHAGQTVQLGYLDRENRQVVTPFEVPACLRTALGLGPEARILRIADRESVKTRTPRGMEEVSVRYHEGTRVALNELVGQRVQVAFRRDLLSPIETAHVDVTADMTDPWLGRISFSPTVGLGAETRLLRGDNALEAVWIGIHKTYYFVMQVYQVLNRMIFSRSVSAEAMSGPLGILDIGGKVAQTGGVKFLFFLAIISANLAVINFLPLPIVDGGLMVFLIIEKIKGSPVSLKVQIATQMIGIFLIIGAFIFVTYNDAVRLWG